MSTEEETTGQEVAAGDDRPDLESFRLRVANLAWGTTDEAFKEFFGKYSPTEAVIIRRKQTNRSRGYGFVTFSDKESMDQALEELDSKPLDEREVTIAVSTSKGPYPEGSKRPVKDRTPRKERSTEADWHGGGGPEGEEPVEVTTKRLIVQRLAWDVDDEKLAAAFAEFGTVESAKVVKNRRSNRSRGYGFVTFNSEEEGQAAMEAMDNNMELGFKKEATDDQEAQEIPIMVAAARVKQTRRTADDEEAPKRRRRQRRTDDGDTREEFESPPRKRRARSSGINVEESSPRRRMPRTTPDRAKPGPRRVFIKDLNEETTQEAVQEAFEKYGKIKDVRLIMDRENPEKSRGFAYVTYEEHEDFKKAIDAFAEGGEVDGADVQVVRAFPSRQGGRGRGRGRRGGGGRRRGRGGGRGGRGGRGAQTGGDDGPTDL